MGTISRKIHVKNIKDKNVIQIHVVDRTAMYYSLIEVEEDGKEMYTMEISDLEFCDMEDELKPYVDDNDRVHGF